jgi:hypothetical protein
VGAGHGAGHHLGRGRGDRERDLVVAHVCGADHPVPRGQRERDLASPEVPDRHPVLGTVQQRPPHRAPLHHHLGQHHDVVVGRRRTTQDHVGVLEREGVVDRPGDQIGARGMTRAFEVVGTEQVPPPVHAGDGHRLVAFADDAHLLELTGRSRPDPQQAVGRRRAHHHQRVAVAGERRWGRQLGTERDRARGRVPAVAVTDVRGGEPARR